MKKIRRNCLTSVSGVLLRGVQRGTCVLCSEVGVPTSTYVVVYCSEDLMVYTTSRARWANPKMNRAS